MNPYVAIGLLVVCIVMNLSNVSLIYIVTERTFCPSTH
jgi:hypothetical protein